MFLRSLDFALRLAFFAAAPFVLVFTAELFPITGALLQIGVALAVFFLAEAIRRASGRAPWLGKLLARSLSFETHYRVHPPRPFLYYVFCPLLLPHWLWRKESRRELLLFKGYTWPTFVLLSISLVVQYVRDFPPELSLRQFWPLALATFLVETLAVLMFLMPLVTTVVQLHLEHAPRKLALLLLVSLASVGFAVARVEKRRDPIVSYVTRKRVRLRQEAQPTAALHAAANALRVGWAALPADRSDIDPDGKVGGDALERGRSALTAFYKNDEAHAFDLWLGRSQGKRTLVVFFPVHRGRAPIWLAMNRDGELSQDPSVIGPRLSRAMGLTKAP